MMIRVGMGTICAYPLPLETAFRISRDLGYDGVEVMVTGDPKTRDAATLARLAERYEQPILSVHAPVLLLTSFVWSRDPEVKLEKTAELAATLGADSVVVHPPFRWQAGYAGSFERIVREVSQRHAIQVAVENMFPWKIARRSLKAYSPTPDPTLLDVDTMTLDFSHASLSGRDSLELALAMGPKLRHIHLCDGSGSLDEGKVFDEHLIPGRGTEPVAEVLEYLAKTGWTGTIAAEVMTRKVRGMDAKLAVLSETLAFARTHLDVAPPAETQRGVTSTARPRTRR
jgi:sugar phosphate isomerase/epimerase